MENLAQSNSDCKLFLQNSLTESKPEAKRFTVVDRRILKEASNVDEIIVYLYLVNNTVTNYIKTSQREIGSALFGYDPGDPSQLEGQRSRARRALEGLIEKGMVCTKYNCSESYYVPIPSSKWKSDFKFVPGEYSYAKETFKAKNFIVFQPEILEIGLERETIAVYFYILSQCRGKNSVQLTAYQIGREILSRNLSAYQKARRARIACQKLFEAGLLDWTVMKERWWNGEELKTEWRVHHTFYPKSLDLQETRMKPSDPPVLTSNPFTSSTKNQGVTNIEDSLNEWLLASQTDRMRGSDFFSSINNTNILSETFLSRDYTSSISNDSQVNVNQMDVNQINDNQINDNQMDVRDQLLTSVASLPSFAVQKVTDVFGHVPKEKNRGEGNEASLEDELEIVSNDYYDQLEDMELRMLSYKHYEVYDWNKKDYDDRLIKLTLGELIHPSYSSKSFRGELASLVPSNDFEEKIACRGKKKTPLPPFVVLTKYKEIFNKMEDMMKKKGLEDWDAKEEPEMGKVLIFKGKTKFTQEEVLVGIQKASDRIEDSSKYKLEAAERKLQQLAKKKTTVTGNIEASRLQSLYEDLCQKYGHEPCPRDGVMRNRWKKWFLDSCRGDMKLASSYLGFVLSNWREWVTNGMFKFFDNKAPVPLTIISAYVMQQLFGLGLFRFDKGKEEEEVTEYIKKIDQDMIPLLISQMKGINKTFETISIYELKDLVGRINKKEEINKYVKELDQNIKIRLVSCLQEVKKTFDTVTIQEVKEIVNGFNEGNQ